jgi:hypothetical protein
MRSFLFGLLSSATARLLQITFNLKVVLGIPTGDLYESFVSAEMNCALGPELSGFL